MRKWIKSPWGISLGTAIFSLILTIGYDYTKEKPILSTILNILIWFWNSIISILNFNLKLWWIIATLGLLIFILYLISKLKNDEALKPDFYNYTEDQFTRWKWTWNWRWNKSKNAWLISNLNAHCPNCDTPMIEHSSIYGLIFDCPRCDFNANDDQCDKPQKIEMLILDNINRKRKEQKQ